MTTKQKSYFFGGHDGKGETEVRTWPKKDLKGREEEDLDEIIVKRGFVHLEEMDRGQIWIDFNGVHLWLTAKGPITKRWFNDHAVPRKPRGKKSKRPRARTNS